MAVHAIAVIGAGAMGSGIAQVTAVAGLGVTLIEISDAAVGKGLDRVKGNLQKLVAKRTMTQAAKEAALGSIQRARKGRSCVPGSVLNDDVAMRCVILWIATSQTRVDGDEYRF